MKNLERVTYSSAAMFLWSMAWLFVPIIPEWLFFSNVLCFGLLMIAYNKVMAHQERS